MVFSTFRFALFFCIVYVLYLSLNHKRQNRMLLLASYVFYGFWDWRFLFLIWASTILDYFCGLRIEDERAEKRKKLFLIISIAGNLSILGFFKYFNFFTENLQVLAGLFGISLQRNFVSIILPVGISFYTFQTMSYTIDIYRGKLKPTKRFLDFALFVAYFPQLVAGPIERAKNLLPQVLNPRKVTLTQFYEGCFLIFWGLIMKVVFADNLAKTVDPIFAGSAPYNGVISLLGFYAFTFQVFCDFAGYSNMARGLSKCMGFEIMVNFNVPFFSTNPVEFWRRNHISLSSWLRDYLYIPLGGSRNGTLKTYRNLILTNLLGGLWHGASWTFVLWGLYNGIVLSLNRFLGPVLKKIPDPTNYLLERCWFIFRVLFFFHIHVMGLSMFRGQSMGQVYSMVRSILFNFRVERGSHLIVYLTNAGFFITILVIIQIFQYAKNDLLVMMKIPVPVRAAFYAAMIYILIIWGVGGGNEFIYFQF